jgi:hypothetical protein
VNRQTNLGKYYADATGPHNGSFSMQQTLHGLSRNWVSNLTAHYTGWFDETKKEISFLTTRL